MKELLTYIVQSLVDHPDEVSVTERKADGETVFEVRGKDRQADPRSHAGRRPEKGQEGLRGDPRLKSTGV